MENQSETEHFPSEQETDQLARNTNKPKDPTISKHLPSKPTYLHKLNPPSPTTHLDYKYNLLNSISLNDENDNPADHLYFISITKHEKIRLYSPWTQSVIIKLLGPKVSYNFLKNKLYTIWQPKEPRNLIDLGYDYYLIKFTV